MAFCSNCGTKLEDNAKFCSGCGVAITATNSQQNQQRKISYDGEILKCPSCGEVLNSFSTVCPSCGYELRGAKTSNSVQELVRKLEELEAKRSEQKMGTVLIDLIKRNELNPIDKQIINIIQNFPIPNTKEDILEFIILASSHTKTNKIVHHSYTKDEKAQNAICTAWSTKLEQACLKASLSFKEDYEFLEKLEELSGKRLITKKEQKEIKKEKFKKFWGI